MKIKFNRSVLQEALGLIATVVPLKTPKPILRCFKITAENDAVLISATDLEVGITCKITHAQVEEPGSAVLPADKANSIVRESSDDVLVFEDSSEDMSINIEGQDSRYTIYGHDIDQFPTVPNDTGETAFDMKLGVLQIAIEQTVFASAKQSTRYSLNGILWELEDKVLTIVGSDGRRLARYQTRLDNVYEAAGEEQVRVIVPTKTMGLIDRIGAAPDEVVSVGFRNNQIVLSCGGVVISSNLVEGRFPRYQDIIPDDCDKTLTVDTDVLLSAVRRASLLVSADSKGIKVTLDDGIMIISGRSPETGDAQINLPVDYTDDQLVIGFNPQYLIDVLRVADQDQVTLEFKTSDRPGVVKLGSKYIYIIMPTDI
ncbi:DNA polymerase III subunit beta [Limihaloglobus sulfuriphilus]|uniref:Beta sliding clamp n=1 Tax=Limihaloglobus sulfuriphilus TaxID=1851148 RepID=A0A1Q2MIN1_9BACT|nr:DNA polymerase III subunit beta [Limihaloglobus sulfuriphilus]AQQ72112.1 DNA polymerase III subunit beta [Limihaloglobus sulfuriphilus]